MNVTIASNKIKVILNKWNWDDTEIPGKETIKIMTGHAFIYMMETVFKNHVYYFKGKIYLQLDSGPIGLELTGAIARLILIWFDKKFLTLLSTLGIIVLIYVRYIDDINLSCKQIPKGWHFKKENNSLVFDKTVENEDCNKLPEVKTFEILKEAANSIVGMLKWESDYPSNHVDGCLPVLDLKIWVDKNDKCQPININFIKRCC